MLKAWPPIVVLMTFLWLQQAKTKNAGYVDLGWVMGLMWCAVFYILSTGGMTNRKIILLFLVSLWGSRLCVLLINRLRKDPSEDRRYRRIRDEWKTNQNFKFFWMFQFQGLLDVVLSYPFALICLNPYTHLAGVEVLGIAIIIVGLIGEGQADEQMRRFKENTDNKGKTCDVGLWYYSRHPNYFFEWLIWVGWFLFALPVPGGVWAILSPVIMLYFLLMVSGVPLAEAQALKTRGEEYRRYQRSTSMFIPWFKKRI